MRDAAGELAQRFHALAVPEGIFRLQATGRFDIEALGPAPRHRQEDDEQRGCRDAEDQVPAHRAEPAIADRRRLQPCRDVDRKSGETLIADAALESVDRRGFGDKLLRIGGGRRNIVRRRARAALRRRKACQNKTVEAAQREVAARRAPDPGIKVLEIIRQHRSLDHAGEAAVRALAAAAHTEERSAMVGRPRRQCSTDEAAGVGRHMGAEVVSVGEDHIRRRIDHAAHQRTTLDIEHPGGLHLRQSIRELTQPAMQRLLAGLDLGVGEITNDFVDLRQAAVDGLEHLLGMLVDDIQRAADVAIGLLAGRTVGDIGRDQEQRDRQRERRHHHPSQHDQRFALCGLHGRSGPQKTTSLTQSAKATNQLRPELMTVPGASSDDRSFGRLAPG